MEKPLNISEFKSGVYERQLDYNSFLPELVNRLWLIDIPELNTLLSEADRKLGELNAFSQLIPNVDFFISMHIAKEATKSSRIEGTQTNIEDALVREEHIQPEKRNDWNEVQNYIKAINNSIAELEHLPISTRLIRDTHKILLQGVRGEHKLPGEYRRSQNWVGATLKDATYIPPHQDHVNPLMSDLENFIHNSEVHVPHLIKIGIIHYQFETIHPFLDGNGRIGRLLITLYLVSNGLLKKPSLYLSDFFDKHRDLYYDNLHRSRIHNDIAQWLKFFLAGIIDTSENSINTFKEIIALRERVEHQTLLKLGSKPKVDKGLQVLQLLYRYPIINIKQLEEELKFDVSTANRLVKDMMGLEILREFTGFKRNRMFVFYEYLSLFTDKK